MASQSNTQPPSRPSSGPRGNNKRGGSRGRGGNRGQPRNRDVAGKAPEGGIVINDTPSVSETKEDNPKDEEEVCWICAEPVKYYAVSECNHRTCHVCALRLRALYKKPDCTFCKDPQPSVIFTTSPDKLFASFKPEDIPYKDSKLAIFFETQEMMEETLILLRFNCPDPDCDYLGNGWGDLKLHTRASHGKLMCDLCIRFKKVFAHEHALYQPNQLPLHLPSMPHRGAKNNSKEQIEGGVHPLCEFCRECFFSSDELYPHMRERHEECFVCKRNDIRDQYFQNYESLEKHFTYAHHPCTQPHCLVRKFVVFNSALDLKAHMVEEHGADMTARDKKDARRIEAEFGFEEVGAGGSSGGRRGHRDRGDREREREPPPQQQGGPPPSLRPNGGGRRREGFGSNLTVENSATPTAGPSRRASPSPPPDNADPAAAERFSSFIARLQSLSSNPASAVPAVKSAIRSYRSSESSARDLISTIWNVLERHLEHTASVVNAFVDILDEEEKKQDLLSSWKGFELEQRRQFPDLVPVAIGSGYAAITTGRVLNAKHSTASRSHQQSSRQVWDRVAQAASSSSFASSSNRTPTPRLSDRFPPLQAAAAAAASLPPPINPSANHPPAFRQGPRNTPWSSSASASTSRPSPPISRPASSSSSRTRPGPPPPKLSNALFPELPTASSNKQRAPVSGNVSLRNILGNPAPPAAPAWQAGGSAGNGGNEAPQVAAESGSGNDPPKGKKGKGKGKQTLFTLGSFPT